MSIKRLKVQLGFLEPTATGSVESLPIEAPSVVRRALLVYEGEFLSMDGPVEVSREALMLLHANHNALIAHNCRLAGNCGPMALPMKDYPPIQLDHSTSARDTVGRLMGEIELGPYIRKDGKEVLAVYGNVCFLGAENCEKASDGRYTHLSVGVDFEKGTFSELTVTPFPAAPEASLLAEKGTKMTKQKMSRLARWYKDDGSAFGYLDNCEVAESADGTHYLVIGQEDGSWVWAFGNAQTGREIKQGSASSASSAKSAAESASRSAGVKILSSGLNWKKFSEGEQMNEELKKRLKKHLTEDKQMSEEEAEKHLAHLSSEEGKEELSKLSAEVDEKDAKLSAEKEEADKLAAEEEEKAKLKKMEEEKKEQEAKLSAAKSNLTRLSTDFRAVQTGAQLAAKKGKIHVRLSALRSAAKITPAEIKKMDIDKLAAGTQETIDAVLKTYEDREPVIFTGQLGSMKATELSKLTAKARMSALEAETRQNMSLLKKTVDADKLGAKKMEDVNVHIDTTPHNHYELEAACDEVGRLMDEGKKEEAKLKMKEHMKKALSGGESGHQDKLSTEETEKQLSALADSVNKMQTQFEELHQLAGTLAGMN